ncbi:EcsC family protein [Xinfangfangia sp. D13-10-4-6]|uniref:EcsC family protein n=1 Tax=Pseudogemmobacter hezensis TaxID=2737662 RepID=UPI00155496E6|nr:EcsC family protein [Pseudogemmobacter hezensis]NPD15875.1 EcsC family protein [Pseudogemmobacter hezensis]
MNSETAKAAPLPALSDCAGEVDTLALRWKRANGPIMSLLTRFGGKLEEQLSLFPPGFRTRAETVTAAALESAYAVAKQGGKLPGTGERGTMTAAIGAGLVGGAGGFASALAELPFTITVLLHAIRREALREGYDPDDPWIMAEALRTFGSGSPVAADDGINTAFFSARVALTGPAINQMIATVAPKLATMLGQKLAAQAVPVMGALSGAALNAAFLRYYREMAAIRFRLLRLSEEHGAEAVLHHFATATAQPRLTKA